MKYEIKIHHDKPFSRSFILDEYVRVDIETQQSAEVFFLNDDGTIDNINEYGYKPPDEIQAAIDNQEAIVLAGCLIQDINFQKHVIKSIAAVGALFLSPVDFSGAKFVGIANFQNAMFNNTANFRDAIFNCESFFLQATFKKEVIFHNVEFNGYTSFVGSVFNNTVDFSDVHINKMAYFSCSTFHGDADFRFTIFRHQGDFVKARFLGSADFAFATIDGEVLFNLAEFNSLAKLNFSKCKKLSLDKCLFGLVSNISCETGFSCLDIFACTNTGYLTLPFSTNIKDAIIENKSSYHEKAYSFNFLKVNYSRNGEYDYEDQAYVEYRRCMRKTKNYFIRFLDWFFLDLVSCYCTKPFHVFYAAVIAIAFFAYLFLIPGLVLYPSTDHYLWNSIYHSIITFFTIGYGNTVPTGWIGLFLTGLEGFVGVFLMSLFTVSFVRKVLR